MLVHGPLTDEELDELERFLCDAEGIDDSMDISMLDGFFAALLSGPTTILPSQWMRWVWDTEKGDDNPVYSSIDEARRIMGLLMRYMNDIATTLLQDPDQYEPLIIENRSAGEPVPVIDEWCAGFMKGVSLDPQGWLPIIGGHPDWMSTIVLYGTEEGWDRLKKHEFPIEEHRRRAAGLGQTVRDIHAHFLDQRKARPSAGSPAVVQRRPIRNTSKVGRNDPCPCGSGRKYKHCHGSAQQLH